MIIQTNNNPLLINFNNLLVDYPKLEQICNQIREDTFPIITRKILRDEIAMLNTPDEATAHSQAKTIRSFALKFKEIVFAIYGDKGFLLVAKKVIKLLNKFQTCEIPNSPTLKQLHPFLDVFRQQILFLPQASNYLSKQLKAGQNLLQNRLELKLEVLLSLKHPQRFVKDIRLINSLNLLDDKDKTALMDDPNPEFLLINLLLKKWDAENIEKSRLIEIIERSDILFSKDPQIHLLRGLLGIKGGCSAFIEKYGDSIQILAVIFTSKFINSEDQWDIWDQLITPQNHEIEFFTHVDKKITHLKNFREKITHVIEAKYSENPRALAVFCRFSDCVFYDIQFAIWDRFIIPNNLEIKFLLELELNLPSAVKSTVFAKSVLPLGSERLKNLVEKQKKDINNVVTIAKIVLHHSTLKNMWEIMKTPTDMQIDALIGMMTLPHLWRNQFLS